MGIVDLANRQKNIALPIELDEKILELREDGRRLNLGQREWRSLLRELRKQGRCLLGVSVIDVVPGSVFARLLGNPQLR